MMKEKVTMLLLVLISFATQICAENWMKRLPNDAYISVLSIPGAHDAATGSGWMDGMEGLGDLFARTQELDIASQWSHGIRAFDLRPCVYEEYMNINHGIMPTVLHMEDALRLLCDSLQANPSEFVIIHMLHASDGDQVENAYNKRIQELLKQETWQPFLVDFRADLKVSDMRGKMLIISRDKYATYPTTGGFFTNWTGEINWSKQLSVSITGQKGVSAKACVQDYSDTHEPGGVEKKVQALKKMLDYTTKHKTTSAATIRWAFNFASAYSLVESLFGMNISSSNGYRDNATHTHAAIIDYLAQNPAGPTGIILMDYVGVDQSGDYHVRGKEAVEAIIANNFRYLEDQTDAISRPPVPSGSSEREEIFTLDGKRVQTPESHRLYLVKDKDGITKRVF